MYTPYAFENANLARSLNIKSFQLQTTNMFSTYEPNFIHADLFYLIISPWQKIMRTYTQKENHMLSI